MDSVHDSRDKMGQKSHHPKDDQSAPTGARGGPTIDVSLERSASPSSITKEESLVVRPQGQTRCVPFNHQMGNCGADVTAPGEARFTAASAEAKCVLQR